MKYRLALDLGSTSLGWGMVLLKDVPGVERPVPCALIRAGVRIFPDGRNPKDGSSLAVTRRNARAMRRRRDRLLKRKARMQRLLIEHGFFPADEAARKALETINPYELRAKGLDAALTPAEFARALFHLNQRRGFKSNRRTDKKDNDSGALKAAIGSLRAQLDSTGADGKARTVGELLWRRMNDPAVRTVRARYREQRVLKDDGKTRVDKSYDLYVDRAMVEAEFDALWAKQAALAPAQFNETARATLKDCLLHQRNLRPVKPGRCTLEPDEPRAPLALPSQQRFRILQEVNHLRLLGGRLLEETLSLEQRDKLVAALEEGSKSFKTAIPKLLGLPGTVQFNLADAKRTELKGNATSMLLRKKDFFGPAWEAFSEARQDEIVMRILEEESEARLVAWLIESTGVDEAHALKIANASLPEGYGSLSAKALAKILPAMRAQVFTYDKAVLAAGRYYLVRSLDRWEMRSGRNKPASWPTSSTSLDRWEMRSGRNRSVAFLHEAMSLDRWEMRSGRNLGIHRWLVAHSLDRWEMRSGRNDRARLEIRQQSLDRWEMRSGRNQPRTAWGERRKSRSLGNALWPERCWTAAASAA